MFGPSYSFSRADEENVERVRKALEETNKLVLELGGVLWKAELGGQRLMMERMDPNTVELMKRLKRALDPNGIMNPGNWD
jgi:glycolate oxidase